MHSDLSIDDFFVRDRLSEITLISKSDIFKRWHFVFGRNEVACEQDEFVNSCKNHNEWIELTNDILRGEMIDRRGRLPMPIVKMQSSAAPMKKDILVCYMVPFPRATITYIFTPVDMADIDCLDALIDKVHNVESAIDKIAGKLATINKQLSWLPNTIKYVLRPQDINQDNFEIIDPQDIITKIKQFTMPPHHYYGGLFDSTISQYKEGDITLDSYEASAFKLIQYFCMYMINDLNRLALRSYELADDDKYVVVWFTHKEHKYAFVYEFCYDPPTLLIEHGGQKIYAHNILLRKRNANTKLNPCIRIPRAILDEAGIKMPFIKHFPRSATYIINDGIYNINNRVLQLD